MTDTDQPDLVARHAYVVQELSRAHQVIESMRIKMQEREEELQKQLQEVHRDKELYKATAFAAQNKVKLLHGQVLQLKMQIAEVHEA